MNTLKFIFHCNDLKSIHHRLWWVQFLVFGILIPCFFFIKRAAGQDPQYTQFYSAPVLTNPAFAGNMEFDCPEIRSNIKATLNNRRQWGNFSTDALTLEYFNKKKKIGVALLAQNQRVEGSKFQNTILGLAGSYKIQLNSEWNFNSGLELAVGNRNIGFSDLKFTDQFDGSGFNGRQTIDNINNTASVFYPDISVGGIFYSTKEWIGISIHHVNLPNISNLGFVERLPMKFAIQGGYKFDLLSHGNMGAFKKDVSLKPVFQFRMQGPFNQLDLGIYYTNDPFVVGLLYRGIPISKVGADKLTSQDAVALLLGFKYEGFRLGYSFDAGLSKIGLLGGGSHEVSASFQMAKKGCKRRKYGKYVPIPSF